MFDDALVESAKSHSLGGKRLSLPIALALHAAVIGAFVGASVWHTEEPSMPEVTIIADVFPGGPKPPRGGGETPREPHPSVAHTAEPRLHIPSPVAVAALEPAPETEPSPNPNGDPTSPPGPGRPDGIEGSTGPLDGDPIGGGGNDPRDGDAILMPGGDVRAPVLLERIEPDYPESIRRARIEGMVILEAVITISGDVREIRVLRSVNPLLDEAAVQAVRAWRYRPATLNGRAVPVYLTVTVRFGIDG